jgi:hypothetical protein
MVEAKESRITLQNDIRQRQKRELKMLEEDEKNARISQSHHSIAWLSCHEKFQENEYERTSRKRHDRTCEWVAKTPPLKSWMKEDVKHPCLWLNGKPGSGMRVCAKIVCLLMLPSKARLSCVPISLKVSRTIRA